MSRVVVALGGNALLPRSAMSGDGGGEPGPGGGDDGRDDRDSRSAIQAENVALAADVLASLSNHELVVTHGNGPQVGLLALQAEASGSGETLDVLGAESEGMIGYLLEREIRSRIDDPPVVTLLTQVEVDPDDPAFDAPDKPIGPFYDPESGSRLAADRGWTMAPPDEEGRVRRVVPSPRPHRILGVGAIGILLDSGHLVVCGGGGGIPVVRERDGRLSGVEAVIDKDRLSALLALEVEADTLLLLTDEAAVYEDWPERSRPIRTLTPDAARSLELPAGSMGPKAEAAADFVDGGGRRAVIGSLEDGAALLAGTAGTRVERNSG